MTTPFIGQLMTVGFNFAPMGWAFCDGQLMAIASHTALFSLLGTVYGGDGRTTFALPDLRGRSVVHPGTGPVLPTITQGQTGGATSFTLTAATMPSHSHTLAGTSDQGQTDVPTNAVPAKTETDNYAPAGGTAVAMVPTGTTGGSQPVDFRSPFLGVFTCIALQGIFPSRN